MKDQRPYHAAHAELQATMKDSGGRSRRRPGWYARHSADSLGAAYLAYLLIVVS
jgi:hypothetical protein